MPPDVKVLKEQRDRARQRVTVLERRLDEHVFRVLVAQSALRGDTPEEVLDIIVQWKAWKEDQS